MSAVHRAVDAMIHEIKRRTEPRQITIHGDDRSIALIGGMRLTPGVMFTAPAPPSSADTQRLRDAGRYALAAALRELVPAASPAVAFELRAIAEQLDTRCPDCGRNINRDPWRHCATCEPTVNSGVTK